MNPSPSVLVVDDSAIARRMIAAELAKVPGVGAVATAGSGAVALTKMEISLPDVVVLDLEMPDMDGIETLVRARAIAPMVPVIMFSSLTERGARVTFEALEKGATDYVLKPIAARGESLESVVANVLGPKVVSLGRAAMLAASGAREALRRPALPVAELKERASSPAASPFIPAPRLIVIASSTGGPNALGEVVPKLSRSFPVPIVVVQHMPPLFTKCLADRLDQQSNVRVREAADGDALRPGTVCIAPGGERHLELVKDQAAIRLRLVDGAPENSCRPAANVLFRSAARLFGPGVLAVVMTGMGEDGLAGAKEIVSAGGHVVVQSGASCVVWGMPRAVELAGIHSAIVPLPGLAAFLERAAAGALEDQRATTKVSSC